MVLADFTITVELDPPRAVRVIVYDSLKGLRIAASRYDNTGKRPNRRRRDGYAHTLGLCHRFEWQSTEGESHPLCAIVRLANPHLGVGVISHELAHATVWIRELLVGDRPLVSDDDEDFCWLLGELVRQTINGMNERGVYDYADALATGSENHG